MDEIKKKEEYLFKIVYKTLEYYRIKPKTKRKKDIREFKQDIADLIMLTLLNIKD
jgi:hypothetical protein